MLGHENMRVKVCQRYARLWRAKSGAALRAARQRRAYRLCDTFAAESKD